MRFSTGAFDAHAQNIPHQSRRRGGLVDLDHLDSASAGKMLDVDDVHAALTDVGLEQLHRRQSQQRVHQPRSAGSAGSKGDGLDAGVRQPRQQRADPPRQLGERGLIGR